MTDRVNPIVVEIIRNAVNSAAREMNSCLIKSAFGPGIYEMKDCSVGIWDSLLDCPSSLGIWRSAFRS